MLIEVQRFSPSGREERRVHGPINVGRKERFYRGFRRRGYPLQGKNWDGVRGIVGSRGWGRGVCEIVQPSYKRTGSKGVRDTSVSPTRDRVTG